MPGSSRREKQNGPNDYDCELVEFDEELNSNRLFGKTEVKLLEEKRTQRERMLTQMSTRNSMRFRDGNESFNQYIPKRIPL